MNVLLPMAYVFIILKNDIFANGKPMPVNDKYTYRLMELEATGDDPDLTRYKYPPRYTNPLKSINPRLPRRQPTSDEDDDQEPPAKIRQKKRPPPNDIEEDISHFRIPTYYSLPKRNIRKRKVKKIVKSPKQKSSKKSKSKTKTKDDYDVIVDDIDDDRHEEEEETEEKKEKIHKVTIKKIRPYKNQTDETQPYRTIMETAQSEADDEPHHLQYPRKGVRPLALSDSADILNPAYQSSEDITTHKVVRPRDVSLILRTKNRHPRILIRRYKPYINALAYPFLGQPPVARPPNVRKKRRRKQRRRRKKFHQPADIGSYSSLYAASQAPTCTTEYPFTRTVDTFSPLKSHYASIYPHMPSSDYFSYEPSKFSSMDVAEPTYDYASAPYDRYTYATESSPFTADIADTPLDSTEGPQVYEEPAEPLPAGEEPMSAPYDVHEHENTAELAAFHKKETDDVIDEDNDELLYDDANAEDGKAADVADNGDVDVEYEENDAEESLRYVSMYGRRTKNSKPIKKVDSPSSR